MPDDATLLRRYAETRSNDAFAELVRRHLNLVYSAALRQVNGDTHLAEDVAQNVFTDLARKAATLASYPVLAGWLHTSTHYAAAKAVRTEQRRRAREQEAHTMQALSPDPTRDAEWARLRPVLDDAIRQLSAPDRDAILLRFFEGCAFAAIGARYRLTENAARMRVDRALEKLRGQLMRRGISSTSGALALVLGSQAVTAAPPALATSVTSAALVGAAGSGGVVSLLQFMAITKSQIALAGALLIAGGATVALQLRTQSELRREIETLRGQTQEIAQLHAENQHLTRAAAEVESLRAGSRALPQLIAQHAALKLRRKNTDSPSQTAAATPRPAGVPAGENYDMKQLDRPPIPTHQVGPVYPVGMRNSGISGEAVVGFVVDDKGDVQDLRIVKSTHEELNSAALDAVKQWKFEPGQKGGRAVNTLQQVPIVFEISTDEADWF